MLAWSETLKSLLISYNLPFLRHAQNFSYSRSEG